MRLLLIEPINALAEFFVKALKDAGFAVNNVPSIEDGKNALADTHFDAMIVDLDGTDGKEVSSEENLETIRALRRYAYKAPVIALAHQAEMAQSSDVASQVEAFLAKPFAMDMLVGAVKKALPQTGENGPINFADLELDTRFAHLKFQGKILPLTRKESALLEALMRRPNTIVDRTVIEQALYGGQQEVGPNALEVLVSRLRKKLIAGKIEVQLLTVRGAGYMLMGAK